MDIDLKPRNFKLNSIDQSPSIDGVFYKSLQVNMDDRGSLTELWSAPWSRTEPVAPRIAHVYYNVTHAGVVKGWHYHLHTFSQYTCIVGRMQVVLIDIRTQSPSFGFVDQFVIGAHRPGFIKIPPGVLKAWKSLSGDSVIINLLTTADVQDNYKIPLTDLLPDIWQDKS